MKLTERLFNAGGQQPVDAMTNNLKIKTSPKLAVTFFASITAILTSCSSPKPTSPPFVTTISPGAPSEAPSFGSSTIVDTATATATVVSIDSRKHEIVLKRPNGKLSHCQARIGIVDFGGIKVGDIVTIAVGEERVLAMGNTLPPDNSATSPARVKVQTGLVALADATETVAFTARIVTIDGFDRVVTLKLADGEMRAVQTTVAVNLADFSPGDVVSARITEVVVLTIQAPKK